MCASAGRDRKKEEEKREKAVEKDRLREAETNGGDVVPGGAKGGSSTKNSKRKMETATVTTHVTTLSFDQEASVAAPTPKRSRVEMSPMKSEEIYRVRCLSLLSC